jgi:hypothetical protein
MVTPRIFGASGEISSPIGFTPDRAQMIGFAFGNESGFDQLIHDIRDGHFRKPGDACQFGT